MPRRSAAETPAATDPRQRREEALAILLRGDRGGQALFDAAAEALAHGLGYGCAVVARLAGDGEYADCLAVHRDGRPRRSSRYPLLGSPFEPDPQSRRYRLHRRDAAALFPRDPLLSVMAAESFQGQILFDSRKRPLGLVFAAGSQPEAGKIGPQRDFVRLVGNSVALALQNQDAEIALRESERRLTDIAEAASDWFWEMDGELRLVYVSKRFERVTGIPVDKILGRTRSELSVNEADRKAMARHLADMAAHRPFRDFRYTIEGPETAKRRLSISGKPVFGAGGRFLGYRGTGRDVTEEIAAAARVERAEARLVSAIETISEGFALHDADDRLVMCNERFRELHPEIADLMVPGVRFDDGIREAARRKLYAVDKSSADAFVAARIARHRKAEGSWEQAYQNGRCVRVSERRTPDGGTVGVWSDITELKRQQARLAQNAATLESILENISQGISLADSDLNLVAFNHRFLELLEFPADRFKPGDPFEKFIRYNADRGEYGPGDPEQQTRERVELARRFESHCFERTRPDGTVIEIMGKPLPTGGFVTTYSDLTRHKENEREIFAKSELLRVTFDNMAQGLIAFDSDLSIVAANDRARELLDVPAELLEIGRSFEGIIRNAAERGDYGPGDVDKKVQEFTTMARGSEAHQFQRVRPDGVVLEIRGHPRPDGGFVITYADATEQRRSAERMEALNSRLLTSSAELTRSNNELEQFAYVASHDLQEPLRMVASYCQLLQRRYADKLDTDADEFIGYAVDGANRMQALINDLLAYSRVGTKGKEFVETDCAKAVDTTLLNLRVAIEESDAVISVDPMPTVPGDETQLVQLFQNLIGNAIKFRREAPPKIHVGAERDGDAWLLSVSDNGPGIEPHYADRIFLIFQRLHGAGEYPGTGIGLAVCRKIVERHGGRIWVESEPGAGCTFKFTLPSEVTDHE